MVRVREDSRLIKILTVVLIVVGAVAALVFYAVRSGEPTQGHDPFAATLGPNDEIAFKVVPCERDRSKVDVVKLSMFANAHVDVSDLLWSSTSDKVESTTADPTPTQEWHGATALPADAVLALTASSSSRTEDLLQMTFAVEDLRAGPVVKGHRATVEEYRSFGTSCP